MGNLLEDALTDKTQRVSILYRVLEFIKGIVSRSRMHTHQGRQRRLFILYVSDIHRCRTCRDHLSQLMDDTHDDMRRILENTMLDCHNRLHDIEELRRRRPDHPRVPPHVAWARTMLSIMCIIVFTMIFLLVFGSVSYTHLTLPTIYSV